MLSLRADSTRELVATAEVGALRIATLVVLALTLLALPVAARGGPLDDASNALERAASASDQAAFRAAMRDVEHGLTRIPDLAARARAIGSHAFPDPARSEARVLLEHLENAGHALAHPIPSDAQLARSRARLDEVLATTEFQQASFKQNLLDRVVHFIGELLKKIFGGVGQSLGASTSILFRIILGLVVVGVLYVLVSLIVRKMEARRGGGVGHVTLDPPAITRLTSAEEWLERARDHRARGEHRMALRCLYLALLRRLHELGAVQIESGQTNWEIVRRLGSYAHCAEVVEATRLFESRWYAMRPVEPEDYDRIMRHYAALTP